EKIIEELFASIAAMDLNALLEQWRYLDLRYFSRLDHRFAGTLPFSRKPETDPEFDVFFSKAWLDTFTVSLNNFLSTVFQNMPLPSLLCFNIDRLHRKALQCEIETLQSMIETLRKEIQTSDAEISSLRDQVALKKVTGARRRRAASMVEQQVVSESSATSTSEEDLARVEEPFIIVSQEIFLEHQSGITHAKFSSEGSLISSCDAENIVRIWTYNGSSAMPPAKISNSCNILSLEWETRDRYVIRFLSYSPVEPILVCAVTSSDDKTGALISINMKTMTTDVSRKFLHMGCFRVH
ncbi:MAG: hypothetical protein BYD32DRAFT_376656, partial [Podila humilis]